VREGSEQLLAKIYLEQGIGGGGKIPKAYLQKVMGENKEQSSMQQKGHYKQTTNGNTSRINNSLMI
jgi:hypothetical protein